MDSARWGCTSRLHPDARLHQQLRQQRQPDRAPEYPRPASDGQAGQTSWGRYTEPGPAQLRHARSCCWIGASDEGQRHRPAPLCRRDHRLGDVAAPGGRVPGGTRASTARAGGRWVAAAGCPRPDHGSLGMVVLSQLSTLWRLAGPQCLLRRPGNAGCGSRPGAALGGAFRVRGGLLGKLWRPERPDAGHRLRCAQHRRRHRGGRCPLPLCAVGRDRFWHAAVLLTCAARPSAGPCGKMAAQPMALCLDESHSGAVARLGVAGRGLGVLDALGDHHMVVARPSHLLRASDVVGRPGCRAAPATTLTSQRREARRESPTHHPGVSPPWTEHRRPTRMDPPRLSPTGGGNPGSGGAGL